MDRTLGGFVFFQKKRLGVGVGVGVGVWVGVVGVRVRVGVTCRLAVDLLSEAGRTLKLLLRLGPGDRSDEGKWHCNDG